MTRSTSAMLWLSLWLAGCDGETKETIAALQERVAGLDQALEDRAEEHETQAEQAAQRVATLETQVADLETDKVALEQRAASLEDQVAALQATAETLRAELTAMGGAPAAKGKIGLPECDEYLEYYRRCIEEKMPEAAREASLNALAATEEAWAKAAQTEAGLEALAEACPTAKNAVKSICG